MMDLARLTGDTSHLGAVALALAFAAGVAASLGPASYALVPAIVGFGVGVAGKRHAVFLRAACAGLGVVAVSTIVGAVAGALGAVTVRWFGSHVVILYAIGAVAFMLIGLRFLGLLGFGAFGCATPRSSSRRGLWDAFALGCALALAACPACTPVLLAVVLGAIAIGHPLGGAVLLATFGLGRTLPIFALAASASLFAKFRLLRPLVGAFERFGGVLLVLSALYLSYEAVATWSALHAGAANSVAGMRGM